MRLKPNPGVDPAAWTLTLTLGGPGLALQSLPTSPGGLSMVVGFHLLVPKPSVLSFFYMTKVQLILDPFINESL